MSFEEGMSSKSLISFSYKHSFVDKKGVDTRLQSAQNALLLQEDTIRRSERERKTMLDQITALERQLLGLDNEKKQILVRNFSFNFARK